mgnify:CR=1 FL=1
MVLSTYFEENRILNKEMLEKVEKAKEFKETELSKLKKQKKIEDESNPFLDKSLRQLIDEFVLTWHKIFLDLLETSRYDKLNEENELWDKFYILIQIMIDIFWKKDRLFHIGVGFVIISFFVFFIMASQ